jgi:hypothetical protein
MAAQASLEQYKERVKLSREIAGEYAVIRLCIYTSVNESPNQDPILELVRLSKK